MAETEKPKKKAQSEELEAVLERSTARNPLVWFFLLFIPIAATIGFTLMQKEPAEAASQAVVVEVIDRAPKEQKRSYGRQVRGEPRGLQPPQQNQEEGACMFPEWVGKTLDQSLKDELDSKNTLYRVLPPNSSMTMDYSAERVNFDLDEKGIITRIWCG